MPKKDKPSPQAAPDAAAFRPGKKTRKGQSFADRALLPRPDKHRKNKNP